MAATDDGFELTSAEQHRLETAIQTVAGRRDGDLPVDIVAEQANLSESVVKEALDLAAMAGTRIEINSDSESYTITK
jgi:hypothetical protein